MHYYQFNIGDYASHTGHLDELEDLAYRRMIDYCYLNEIGLPGSVEEVARLIRMRTHCERIAVVLREFFTQLENGEWVNKRASDELYKIHTKSEKAQESARKRWEKHHANASETHNGRNAIQEPRTKNQEPVIKRLVSAADAAPTERTKKGSRLSTEWKLPMAWGCWAMDNGMDAETVRSNADVFRDYWVSKSGAAATKNDWEAAWRNWVRKAMQDKRKGRPPDKPDFIAKHTDKSWRDEK